VSSTSSLTNSHSLATEMPNQHVFKTFIRSASTVSLNADSQSSLSSEINSLTCSSQDSVPEPECNFILRPGSFEVLLCVDNCETAGGWVLFFIHSMHFYVIKVVRNWPLQSFGVILSLGIQ
jgi:hypothetical protein